MNDINSFTFYREYLLLINMIKNTKKRDEFLGKLIDYIFKDIEPTFAEDSDEFSIWENLKRPINKSKNKSNNAKKDVINLKSNQNQNEIKKEAHQDVDVDVNNYDNNYVVNVNKNINIYEFIESNFGRTISPVEYQEIKLWEDNELTRHAVKEAILNNAYSIKYIVRILDDWKVKNIRTVAEAQEYSKKFREQGTKTSLTSKQKIDLEFQKYNQKLEEEKKSESK